MAIPRSGQGVPGNSKLSRQCNNCSKYLGQTILRCKNCKLVYYCNRECQRTNWTAHKTLCDAIQNEKCSHRENETMQHDNSHIYISHLTPKEHGKLINLVGRKCSVRGKLNGKTSDILWDTDAQVSIISENFVSKTFTNIPIRDVSELLECGLTLTAANGSKIPYVGWVELKLQVQNSANEVSVPFLVTRENLELPLVGFNVTEHMINSGTLQENDILTRFVGINTHNAVTLLDLVKEINHGELCLVKTPKKDTVIPRGQVAKICCRVNTGPLSQLTQVLFEADENGHWPGGLQVSDNLLTIKAGKASKIEKVYDCASTIASSTENQG